MLAKHMTSFSVSQAHVYYRELRLVVVSDCPETMLRIYWTVGYNKTNCCWRSRRDFPAGSGLKMDNVTP